MTITEKWEVAQQVFDSNNQLFSAGLNVVVIIAALLFLIMLYRKNKKEENGNRVTSLTFMIVEFTVVSSIIVFGSWVAIQEKESTMKADFFKANKEEIISTNMTKLKLKALSGTESLEIPKYVKRTTAGGTSVKVRYVIGEEDGFEYKELVEATEKRILYSISDKEPTVNVKRKGFSTLQLKEEFDSFTKERYLFFDKLKPEYQFLSGDGDPEYTFNIPNDAILDEVN